MNLSLICLSLVSLLGELCVVVGGAPAPAPAVTSVHVSFVSGNKKTQYSHGTHTRPAVVQYNLDAAGTRNEFGALKNFIGGGHGHAAGPGPSGVGGGIASSHTHPNPESLSPDGVFLPPLPTEASDYSEDSHDGGHGGGGHGAHHHHDPYLADQETAKYAAQHPPFFAAFPHKRTVLDLNERRVEQGLEPNILRSIRPFFAFFDAANPRHNLHHSHYHSHSNHHHHHSHSPHHHSPHDNDNHLHPESVVVAEVHGHLPPPHHLLPVISSTPITTGSNHGIHHGGNHLGGETYHALILPDNPSHSPLLEDDENVVLLAQSLLANSGNGGGGGGGGAHGLEVTGGSGPQDVAEAWSLFPHKKRKK